MKVNGRAIIVTDPCYITKDGDWDKSHYGEKLNKLGFTDYISKSTLYGDWSAKVFQVLNCEETSIDNIDFDEIEKYQLGNFCADAGMVCAVYVDELLQYNPDFFKKHGTHTFTIITEFQAKRIETLEYEKKHHKPINEYDTSTEAVLVGYDKERKIKILAFQTGF